jgi:hypothetical protein
MCDQAKGMSGATPSFVFSKQTLSESNAQEIKKIWGAVIEVRDCKNGFEKRPLARYLKGLEARIDKLEKKAAFVKGFEKATKKRRAVPMPKSGEIWKDHKRRPWIIEDWGGHIGTEYVHLKSPTDESGKVYRHKTILIKSLRKHYRPEGWEDGR